MENQKDTDVQTNEELNTNQIETTDVGDLETPPTLTFVDIRTMIAVINTATERGGFRGAELETVGTLYKKLVQFVAWAEKAQADQEEAETLAQTKNTETSEQ